MNEQAPEKRYPLWRRRLQQHPEHDPLFSPAARAAGERARAAERGEEPFRIETSLTWIFEIGGQACNIGRASLRRRCSDPEHGTIVG